MKREVLITQSMERFVEARNRLSGAGQENIQSSAPSIIFMFQRNTNSVPDM